MTIAQRIKRIRKRLKLSQQQAALRFYVVQSTWSKWENGTMIPSKARLDAILKLDRQ